MIAFLVPVTYDLQCFRFSSSSQAMCEVKRCVKGKVVWCGSQKGLNGCRRGRGSNHTKLHAEIRKPHSSHVPKAGAKQVRKANMEKQLSHQPHVQTCGHVHVTPLKVLPDMWGTLGLGLYTKQGFHKTCNVATREDNERYNTQSISLVN